jgi:hypothetical protein
MDSVKWREGLRYSGGLKMGGHWYCGWVRLRLWELLTSALVVIPNKTPATRKSCVDFPLF